MEKIVVTGGAGFIGSHLVNQLVEEGYDVHVIDNLSAGQDETTNEKATLHVVDVRDDAIADILKDATYVFHMAANPSVEYSIQHPKETNDNNVNGLLNVLAHAHKAGVKRVVISSSCAVYGDAGREAITEDSAIMPKSPYALHKAVNELQCETWSRVYGLETVCLRYFNVYGPNMNAASDYSAVIAKFLQMKGEGSPLTITGDGSQTRDFVHVSDVVRANILAAKSDKVGSGERINIGSGSCCSILNLAQNISDNIQYIEPRVEIKDSLANNSRAKALIDWEPKTSLEEGLKELI